MARFVERNKCFGVDSANQPRPFVPRRALEEFWTRNKITEALCAVKPDKGWIGHDALTIHTKYLQVFSVLVSAGVEHWADITLFMEAQLDDKSLPIVQRPVSWQDEAQGRLVYERFEKHQWKFCPFTFDDAVFKANFPYYLVLPIQLENKKKLNPEKSDLDEVVVYRVDLHPECQGFIPSQQVVFKEYHDKPDLVEIFGNEADLYGQLRNTPGGQDHIIQYYGCFQRQGIRTLVLEYAPLGNLAQFFDKNGPITREVDCRLFWTRFMALLKGLDKIHNLNVTDGGEDRQWNLRGVHQDIRPQNILVFPGETNDKYDVHFKFADFGTSHLRKCRLEALDTMALDHHGNGMYSPPETNRDDHISRPVLAQSDIWSLGGVASEALVWTRFGEQGRSEYQKLRNKHTDDTAFRGGYHDGCFHDGSRRLRIVDDMHHYCLDGSRAGASPVSQLVSRVILDSMLQADLDQRLKAKNAFMVWDEAVRRLPNPMSLQTSVFQVLPPGLVTQAPLLYPSQEIGTTSRYYSKPQMPEVPPQFPNPAGQGLLYNLESRDSIVDRLSYLDPREHHGANQIEQSREDPPMRGITAPEVQAMAPERTISRNPESRPPSQIKRPRSPRSMDDYGQSPTSRQSQRQSQPAHLETMSPLLTYPSPRDRNSGPDDSAEARVVTPDHDDPPYLKDSIFPRATHTSGSTSAAAPIISVDEVYKDIKQKGKIGMFSGTRAYRKILSKFPPLKEALLKLKGVCGRDQVFVIDDSGTMKAHRSQMAKTLRVLSYLLKNAGVDPDKSFDVYFTCEPGKRNLKTSSDLENLVENHEFSTQHCDMATGLDEIISQVLKATEPTSIYVLTNARWNSDTPDSLCGVDRVIKRSINGIEKEDKQRNWIGFQFIRFYGAKGDNDALGRSRLDYLDNKLDFGSDIVDTRDWEEDVCSMLTGGVFPDEDVA